MAIRLDVESARLEEICRRHGVARLDVFGSFASGDENDASDVDLLVTFKPDAIKGLDFVELAFELEKLFGRDVDLLTRSSVERSPNKYFRRYALSRAEPIYEAS